MPVTRSELLFLCGGALAGVVIAKNFDKIKETAGAAQGKALAAARNRCRCRRRRLRSRGPARRRASRSHAGCRRRRKHFPFRIELEHHRAPTRLNREFRLSPRVRNAGPTFDDQPS